MENIDCMFYDGKHRNRIMKKIFVIYDLLKNCVVVVIIPVPVASGGYGRLFAAGISVYTPELSIYRTSHWQNKVYQGHQTELAHSDWTENVT